MIKKYFNATGEIAFRMWIFANAVKVLEATPNEEKARNLKSKMEAFSVVIAEKGTPENKADLEALIAGL